MQIAMVTIKTPAEASAEQAWTQVSAKAPQTTSATASSGPPPAASQSEAPPMQTGEHAAALTPAPKALHPAPTRASQKEVLSRRLRRSGRPPVADSSESFVDVVPSRVKLGADSGPMERAGVVVDVAVECISRLVSGITAWELRHLGCDGIAQS